MFAFAAAGTGGHVYPALAVADRLLAAGLSRSDIVFFGGSRMERDVVPAAGFDFVELPLIALRRSLSPANLRIPFVVWRAVRAMRAVLRARGVRVLLAMGGYVTVPARFAAPRSGVALFLHEQNARPGLANRMAARTARRVFVAFEGAASLPGAEVIGNPLRAALIRPDSRQRRGRARLAYGLPADARVLGVLGGSQGALKLNEAVLRLGDVGSEPPAGVAVLHVAGTTHSADVAGRVQDSPVPWVVLPFEDSMEDFYAACDLVVCRGGAVTMSELAATGTPAVVVPLAAAAGGEQHANAAVLAGAGAAEVLEERDLGRLPAIVIELLNDPARLEAMSAAASTVARLDAADIVAGAMLEEAHG